jgi:hypothetical protein
MRTNKNSPVIQKKSKADFFKTVLSDKRAMRDYIREYGSLEGFKSTHFEFAKPI